MCPVLRNLFILKYLQVDLQRHLRMRLLTEYPSDFPVTCVRSRRGTFSAMTADGEQANLCLERRQRT